MATDSLIRDVDNQMKALNLLEQYQNGRLEGTSQPEGSVSSLNNAINKEVMVFLSQLTPGSLLKGEIIKEANQMFLKLPNGMEIAAKCEQQLVPHQIYEFVVTDKARQHLTLKLSDMPQPLNPNGQPFVADALNELGIVQEPFTKEVLSQFVLKELPLDKGQLEQVIRFAKYLQMPAEPFTTLLSQKQPLVAKEADLVAGYKGQETQVVTEKLAAALSQVTEQGKPTFITILQKIFDVSSLKAALHLGEALPQADRTEKPFQPELPEKEKVLNETARELEEVFQEEGISDSAYVLKQLSKMDINSLKDLFLSLVKEKMTLDLNKEDMAEETQKIEKNSAFIKKVADTLKESGLEAIDSEKLQQLTDLSETLQNYEANAQYFCFPFQVHGQPAEGELYFFKPKKKKKEAGAGMYIVLALQMPALKKVEVHIKENKSQIDLVLKTEQPAVAALFNKHQTNLQKMLEALPFQIGSISCSVCKTDLSQTASIDIPKLTKLDEKI